jgi:hypothetical protein
MYDEMAAEEIGHRDLLLDLSARNSASFSR